MTERRPQGRRFAAVFMILWIVFWLAGMLIVLYGIGRSLAAGEVLPVIFMLVWLTAAAFGLYMGVRKLRALFGYGDPSTRTRSGRKWRDDISAPTDGTEQAEPGAADRAG